jgi:hypothetical protein
MPAGRAQQWTAGASRRLADGARSYLADGGARLPAWALLAVLCAASATLLVVLGSRLSFFNDDWHFVLQRTGFDADTIFESYNGHLSAVPVLAYKSLIGLFGLDSQVPFRLAISAVVIGIAVAVFIFVRERAGNVLALEAAALLLFLGPAWEDLLFFSSVNLMLTLLAGVCVLILLGRDTPRRNLAACLILIAAVLTSNLALPFIAAATVAVLLRGRPGQLWIPAAGAVVFAIWWIAYGHDANTAVTWIKIARSPGYALDALGSGLASATGLSSHSLGTDFYDWARPLLALAVVGVAFWLYRGGRPRPYLAVVAVAALTFWLLAAFNFTPGREAAASRYQLISVTFVILIAAEMLRPIRLGPRALALSVVLTAVVIASNAVAMKAGYDLLRGHAAFAKGDLGALEIGQAHIPDDFQLIESVSNNPYLVRVTAGGYYREGIPNDYPAYTPEEIAVAPPDVQQGADHVLTAGYAVALAPAQRPRPGRAREGTAASGCRVLPPVLDFGARELDLAPGSAVITNLSAEPASISLRRFAPPDYPTTISTLGGGLTARLRIPTDAVQLPWYLSAPGGALEVCDE